MHQVQLPELHRCRPLPPLPGLPPSPSGHRVDNRGSNQAAIDRRLRRRRLDSFADQFEGDSASSPVGMSSAHLQHHGFNCRRDLMRAMSWSVRPITQAFQSVAFVAQQPTVHRPRRNTPVPGHLAHRPTITNYRQHCLVPLLSHAHLPHARERDKSAEVAVTHHPKVSDTSADGLFGPVSRTCTRLWLGRKDSNLQPSDPESAALPLRHSPSSARLQMRLRRRCERQFYAGPRRETSRVNVPPVAYRPSTACPQRCGWLAVLAYFRVGPSSSDRGDRSTYSGGAAPIRRSKTSSSSTLAWYRFTAQPTPKTRSLNS